MWVALQEGVPVARVAWWGNPADGRPSLLDVLDVRDDADVSVATGMLRTALGSVVGPAGTPPDYVRFIPPDWRDDATARRVVERAMHVAAVNGARLLVERLRFEWRRGEPVPAETGRLRFRATGEDELVDLMTRVLDGTLDAHSRRDLAAAASPRDVALEHFSEELARYGSPRSWWRVGMLPSGDTVGFVVPARNDYGAIIAYIGVLPEHRGSGHIDGLLAEGMRILARDGAPRIRATTDVTNVPMARAFSRAGWHNFERAITMTWS